jgi:general stress protein YciG
MVIVRLWPGSIRNRSTDIVYRSGYRALSRYGVGAFIGHRRRRRFIWRRLRRHGIIVVVIINRDKHREIAQKGGKAAHVKGTAHEWTSEQAPEAGRKGGTRQPSAHERTRDRTDTSWRCRTCVDDRTDSEAL